MIQKHIITKRRDRRIEEKRDETVRSQMLAVKIIKFSLPLFLRVKAELELSIIRLRCG